MRLKICFFFLGLFIFGHLEGKPEIPGVTKEASRYKRVFDRPHVFIQTQFYSLRKFTGGHMSRYSDQPLLFDPDIPDQPRSTRLSLPDFTATMTQMMEYHVDGMSFFPSAPGRMGLINYLDQLPVKVTCLPNTYGWGGQVFPTPQLIRTLQKSKSSLRYKGKLVLVGYTDDAYCKVDQYAEQLAACRKAVGDCFWIVPQLTRTANWAKKEARSGQIPDERKIAEEKEYIRKWLRISDGVMISPPYDDMYVVDGVRKTNYEYFDNYVVALVQSVLGEPEFSGKKLFMISTTIGHENAYKVGYVHSHDGTRTLRGGLDSAFRAGPDAVILCEWDEWNENTSHCPTVYNSFSTKRIVRYYMDRLRGGPACPLPGDDSGIPNLILSYRKTLSLGEILKFEVLNVPDGSFEGSLDVRLNLLSVDGKMVRSCKPRRVFGEKLSEAVFELASEEFSGHRVLLPELSFRYRGNDFRYSAGFHYIDLRGSWNWDFKWVKQPLRDLLPVSSSEFSRRSPQSADTVGFRGSVRTEEPLSYVQVLDNDDVIYISDPSGSSDRYREGSDHVVFHISAISRLTLNLEKGRLCVLNAENPEWVRDGVVSRESVLPVKDVTRWWNIPMLLRIPRKDLSRAVLRVEFPGVFEKEIGLQEVYERFLMSWSGKKGFNLTLTGRYLRQFTVPSHLNARENRFEMEFIPDTPASVVHMQVISKSGRTWRSRPIVLGSGSPKVPVLVWSEMQKKNVLCHVPSNLVPVLRYDFSPRHGDILCASEGGRACYGILGASVGPAVGRNWGPGADSTTYGWHNCNNTIMDSVPKRRFEEGKWELDFDGKGMIAVFPHSAVPRSSAWTLSFDFRTSDVEKKQTLLVNGYPPIMNGLIQCHLEKGRIQFIYGGMTADYDVVSDAVARADQWNRVKLICLNDGIQIELNGKKSRRAGARSIPGRFTPVTSLGGMPGSWFKGQIRNFVINQRYEQ